MLWSAQAGQPPGGKTYPWWWKYGDDDVVEGENFVLTHISGNHCDPPKQGKHIFNSHLWLPTDEVVRSVKRKSGFSEAVVGVVRGCHHCISTWNGTSVFWPSGDSVGGEAIDDIDVTGAYPPLWSWWWYPQWSYWWWSTDPQQGRGFRGQGGLSQLLGWCRFQVPAEKGLAWHVMTRSGSIHIEVVQYQGKEWQKQPRQHDAQDGSPADWWYAQILKII